MVSWNDDKREETPQPAGEAADAPEESREPAPASRDGLEAIPRGKDLAAALCVGAVAVLAMILGLLMPNPGGSVFTAPGFMPFLTGLSLLAMAAGLGAGALRWVRGEGRAGRPGVSPVAWLRYGLRDYENQWAIILMGMVVLYVLLIDWVTFEVAVPLGVAGWWLGFSSFEAVTIPALAVVLRLFWPKPFLRCFLVSLASTMILAAAFRYGFHIPLPGSG